MGRDDGVVGGSDDSVGDSDGSVGDSGAAWHFTRNADVLVAAAVLEMVAALEIIFSSRWRCVGEKAAALDAGATAGVGESAGSGSGGVVRHLAAVGGDVVIEVVLVLEMMLVLRVVLVPEKVVCGEAFRRKCFRPGICWY